MLTPSQIGETLKEWRKSAKLTQTEAAQRMAVEPITVSRWERGAVKGIKTDNLVSMARVYGVQLPRVMALFGKDAGRLVRDVSRGTAGGASHDRAKKALRESNVAYETLATGNGASHDQARLRRAEQFEREMIRFGADDYEADHVRVRSRTFLESVLSSGGTKDVSDEELDRELELYLENNLRVWVIEHMKRRGAEPKLAEEALSGRRKPR